MFRNKILLTISGVILLSVYFVPSVLAQTSGQGLQISPPIHELNLEPGDKQSFNIKLTNISGVKVIAKAQTNDFVAADEEGHPQILLDDSEDTSPYGMRDWFGSIKDIQLDPNETTEVKVNLSVPESAAPGGHYGIVRFTAVPANLTGQGLSLSASIGALVLARVAGDINESLDLVEFYTSRDSQRATIFERGPISFIERFTNSGNVHVKPQGEVTIKNIFGQEIAKFPVNSEGGNVLPSSTRRFEQEFNKNILFGRYTASLTVNYGTNQNLGGVTTFWVIPYKLVGVIIAGILGLIILTRLVLTAYERRIINKSSPR